MRVRAAATAMFFVVGLAAAVGQAGTSEPATLGPGCAPARPGLVYTSEGVVTTPTAGRPVPCLVTIPRSSQAKETQLAITKAGTIVYQADLTLVDGDASTPLQVAVSNDQGRTWRGRGTEFARGDVQNSGIDNHLYRDPQTDRLFWIVYGVASHAPQPTAGISSDGGHQWHTLSLPCCSDAENPRLLAAKPRVSRTAGYPCQRPREPAHGRS